MSTFTKPIISLSSQIENLPINSISPNQSQQGIYDQFNNYFNEQDQQRKTVGDAREVLGESAESLTDEQVYDLVNEVQYLVDTWLEEYEKKVFDGKTLDELLQHEL